MDERGRRVYWFASEPTLRKLAEARAQEKSDEEADEAIIALLRQDERAKGRFARVHTASLNPEEAEENSAVGLVVLHPSYAHDARSEASPAEATVTDALKRRSGGRLRQARNTLIFVAPDAAMLAEARKAAKWTIAWKSIRDDRALDLKDSQKEEVAKQFTNSTAALEASVRRAWSHVFHPVSPRVDGEPFALERVNFRNPGSKAVAQAVWERVSSDQIVLEKLGRQTLSDRLKENWPSDADHVALSTIRDWFIGSARFERVRDEIVLGEAVSELVRDGLLDFSYADSVGPDGHYQGLASGKVVTVRFDGDALLVRRSAADAQERAKVIPTPASDGMPSSGPDGYVNQPDTGGPASPAPARSLRRFYGSVDLNPDRPVRDLQPIIDSIISELMRTDGAKLTLRLEIEATASSGFAPDDAAIIRDNARTLKFRPEGTGFSED